MNQEECLSDFFMLIHHNIQKVKDIYQAIKLSLKDNAPDGMMQTINSSAFAPKLYNLTQQLGT
jgi:hypothetical protein